MVFLAKDSGVSNREKISILTLMIIKLLALTK